MSISSIVFILGIMSLSILLYYLIPGKGKNVLLLLISLIFYAWGNVSYLTILCISILFNYFTGIEIEESPYGEKKSGRRLALISGVVFNILVLGFFKYYGFLIENINVLFKSNIPIKALPLPIGISFFTFSALSYLFDVYRRDSKAQRNILDFSLYISFFAKITSGPIVRYADFEEQLEPHYFNFDQFGSGLTMFIRGLGKKVLLADGFGLMFSSILNLPQDRVTVLSGWLLSIAYTLQIYLDFAGYSDMAIGLAKMLGFEFNKNFDYPYISTSVSEFWRRWHISLGTWFREYVYIPLGGNRRGPLIHIRNMLIVWLLTGIWHGASWTFIAWGLYYGVILIIEKYISGRILKILPAPISRLITMLVVMIGWMFFSAESIEAAIQAIGHMFGFGVSGIVDLTVWYYIKTYIVRIIIGALISTPIFLNVFELFLSYGKGKNGYISAIIYIVVFVISIAYLVTSNYQTFLYVNF